MIRIYNINVDVFGGPLRTGDLIAAANAVQYLRNITSTHVKFHMLPESVSDHEYCIKFYNFLVEHTDYFSLDIGEELLPWKCVNLWDFRDISGDLMQISNPVVKPDTKKIVICPLFDAAYNKYRNWTPQIFHEILSIYNSDNYSEYDKVICSITNIGDIPGWTMSTDFMDNLQHIMECDIFIGGDTGTSHFAGVLFPRISKLEYYYSSRGLIHSLPFHALNNKDEIHTYWLNCENSTF